MHEKISKNIVFSSSCLNQLFSSSGNSVFLKPNKSLSSLATLSVDTTILFQLPYSNTYFLCKHFDAMFPGFTFFSFHSSTVNNVTFILISIGSVVNDDFMLTNGKGTFWSSSYLISCQLGLPVVVLRFPFS